MRQPYVDRLAAEFAADCTLLRHGSARLVELAEAKLRGEATDPADYARELAGLLDQPGGERVDTVVLACTHFPLVAAELAAAAPMAQNPRPLIFVDGGEGIARRVAYLLSNTAADPAPPRPAAPCSPPPVPTTDHRRLPAPSSPAATRRLTRSAPPSTASA